MSYIYLVHTLATLDLQLSFQSGLFRDLSDLLTISETLTIRAFALNDGRASKRSDFFHSGLLECLAEIY